MTPTLPDAPPAATRRRALSPLSARRRVIGWVLALTSPGAISLLFLDTGGLVGLPTQVLVFLALTVAVALVGGTWPALACALVSFLCINWFFTPPTRLLSVADPENLLALLLFVLVAVGVASVVDLAARRHVQASRAAVLAETDAARTALLAAVSHDLRTPLAAIRTAVDGLRATDVELAPQDADALVETVATSTGRLEQLIDNLLDLSRLQAGAVVPSLRAVSLDEVVPVAIEPVAGSVELALPDDLPFVHTDPGLLERVVANVVANAVRWSPGRVQVAVAVSPARVELRVVDRGPGLDAAAKARMFEPFQRLSDTGGSGVGLGLAVAQGFARAVGATILPEDTPEGGLTMVVSVPRAEPHRDEPGV
ncbi:sensor histidine kinase [Cellulosimicrobium arenosum]|nr:DUF4118 domain-containing protein [Cellulosimicrobium arenosum]